MGITSSVVLLEIFTAWTLCVRNSCAVFNTFIAFLTGHALLACGISDGSISIIRVEQTLFPASSTPELVAGYEDSVVSGALHIKSDVPSGQALTSLRWIETPQMDVSHSDFIPTCQFIFQGRSALLW